METTAKQYLYKLATDQERGLIPSILKGMLLCLSFVYGGCVRVILFCFKAKIFRSYALPKTVISVGNITMGGVGKTPLVEYIANFLSDKKLKIVVLTRGYMGRELQTFQKRPVESDEALALEESLEDIPVVVNSDRVKGARWAMEEYPVDAFLLDDGFHQMRLKRNLDIVVIDATNPFGNGHTIPRGILREKLDALKRADVFVLTRTDFAAASVEALKSTLKNIHPRCPVIESRHVPVSLRDIRRKKNLGDPQFLKGKKIVSFCAIGHSKSFEMMLKNLGADVVNQFDFLDHYTYQEEDIRTINRFCTGHHVTHLVTTQKDSVKLDSLQSIFNHDFELFSLRIQIQISKGKEEFHDLLSHAYTK